jgi:hypothetical protein
VLPEVKKVNVHPPAAVADAWRISAHRTYSGTDSRSAASRPASPKKSDACPASFRLSAGGIAAGDGGLPQMTGSREQAEAMLRTTRKTEATSKVPFILPLFVYSIYA